jgi:capsular polysaccharide biosynthesis protein
MRSTSTPAVVQGFDQVRGVEVIDVDLPREPAADPTSRTVQARLHPNFVRHYSQPSYELRVAQIPNGRLALSGGVFTPQDDLVLESLWDQPHFERDFARMKHLPSPHRLTGTGASIISLWGENYFHWIFNCLPRLAVLQASNIAFDYLIVPENLRPFQSATLERLGYSGDMLVPFTGQHVVVERLVWAAPLAPINEPSRFLLEWVRSNLRSRVEIPSRRLYVSRRGGTRRAVNEDEIYGRLEPLGYEFILPEEYSFDEQLEVFGQARVAVGPHGSNFVNGVFSDRLSVLECFQPEHVNWGVYSVLCAAGHDHWNILCESVRRRGPKRFADMRIDWQEMHASLTRIDAELASHSDAETAEG